PRCRLLFECRMVVATQPLFVRPCRSAKILPFLTVLLPALFGFVGLVFDTGLLLAAHRQAQNAADSAAMAGALRLMQGAGTSTAQSDASTFFNTYSGLTNSTVTVNVPPQSGL